MEPWWDRIPGRLKYELDALERERIQVTIDEDARAQGVLRLFLELPEDAPLTRRLVAVFPETYPYTRPEVLAPDLDLGRHQNPFSKNLCLLGRESANWRTKDTLASILRSQLSLLNKALAAAVPSDVEEIQGEPFSTYLTYETGSIVFVDSGWKIPPHVRYGTMALTPLDDDPIRAVVRSIKGAEGDPIARGPFGANDAEHLRGIWTRLKAPVVSNSPEAWMKAFSVAHPTASLVLKKRPDIIGFVFPEELGHRTTGDGWVFVTRQYRGNLIRQQRLARAARVGLEDLSVRWPFLKMLSTKKIAVFGLGCIGAPSLIEFARVGVGELRFLDPDVVEAGTAVRWPFGVEAAGWPKAAFLLDFIERHFPWIRVVPHEHRVGAALESRDSQVIDQMFGDVDLVYDATAELGIQHLLSDMARQRGIPYVCISGTPGGTSGVVARIRHDGHSACWMCFQQALTAGTIELPKLQADERVQPQGCANPTFVGANYDFMEVALQGVRLAIGTLLGGEDRKEDFLWDVAVLRHRNVEGQRIEPRWHAYSLAKDPECPACSHA